ncbi:hypothetical protein FH966_15670 [Lentibacillus cibarius]|uniref:Uncharacterized protein n=1 Tax=Lentibacillus cibarius TaxID=2583219 RepID=A0A549YMC2_9BACI|nr:hypothetical protein [Lentibacillus cibarius]TRM13030.1 hypothetical protein FH966_15670 [Lentibacillus cibarius]
MMEFLYFPEDKTEYIPAVITLIIFMIGAVITMYFFIKVSRKEEKKAEKQYQQYFETKKDSD